MNDTGMPITASAGSPVERARLLDEGFGRLEDLLGEQLEVQQEVAALIGRQRDALRRADVDAVVTHAREQRTLIERQRRLDLRRDDLVRALAEAAGTPDGERTTLSDLAEHAIGPRRPRLVALGAQLRELAERVRDQSAVVRLAVEGLARHMQGIAQSLEGATKRAIVYGRAGRLDPVATSAALDLRS